MLGALHTCTGHTRAASSAAPDRHVKRLILPQIVAGAACDLDHGLEPVQGLHMPCKGHDTWQRLQHSVNQLNVSCR